MATNNEQVFNQKNKLSYSKELELLDALDHQLNEAANNLDIDKIQRLLEDFEKNHLTKLRMANQQSFEVIKAHAHQRILEIKKRKEILAQRQREIQNTEDAYKKLQDIKKMVLGAKTKSELEKAKKKYEKWKNEVGRSRKVKFGWKYNKKVDNLKTAIADGIGPEDAISELKTMIDRASHSGGFENDSQIKNWMSKYPLNAFHEVYKKEVRDLTDKAFSLIKEPEEDKNSESKDSKNLIALIPGFLFMSPTQAHAVNDLKKIMDKNSNNFRSILEWIYIYRNVPFSEPYRQAISMLMPPEYGLNLNKQYSIPTFYDNRNLKSSEIKNLVRDTVINYFGILLCGNDLSSTKQKLIADAFIHSQKNEALSEVTKTDEEVDKIMKAEDNSIISVTYSEDKKVTEMTINDNFNEPTESSESVDSEPNSLNVETTPISDTISTTVKDVSPEIQVEISSILPDIEFVEEQFTSSSIIIGKEVDCDNKLNDESEESLEENTEEIELSQPQYTSVENQSPDHFEITASYEEISESAIEIPLITSEKIANKNKENSEQDIRDESIITISQETSYNFDTLEEGIESPLEITYSETVENSPECADPYQLTEYDIENIENLYSLVNSRTKQAIKPQPSFEIEEPEEENDLLYQKIKD